MAGPLQVSSRRRQQMPARSSIGVALCLCIVIAFYAVNFAVSTGFIGGTGAAENPEMYLQVDGFGILPRNEGEKPVNVLFGLSGSAPGFWSEVEVALKSILLNAPVDMALAIHCLVDEEAHESMLKLLDTIDIRSWRTRNQISIKLYNIQPKVERWTELITETWNKHYDPKEKEYFRHKVGAYFRLFATEVLPVDVEHVIYMDSDVAIMANLQEIWKVCSLPSLL